jgi:hypothetical protein
VLGAYSFSVVMMNSDLKLLSNPLEPVMAEPTSVAVAVLKCAHLCSLNRNFMYLVICTERDFIFLIGMAGENVYIIVNCEKLTGLLCFYCFKVWKVRSNFIALRVLVLDLLKSQFVTQYEPFCNELKKLVFCNTILLRI